MTISTQKKYKSLQKQSRTLQSHELFNTIPRDFMPGRTINRFVG